MADFMDILQGQLSDGLIGNLTEHLGIEDKTQTETASKAIFSVLGNALSKNASTPSGAGALASALDRDHDGSILDDLGGFLTGATQQTNSRSGNGAGILGHILGSKQNSAIDIIAQMSGLDKNKTTSLMIKLAPVILGMLGKAKRENQLDQGGLSDLLKKSTQSFNKKSKNTDFISSILDQDGDGSIMDDVAKFGMKALSGFFKRK